MLCFLVVVLVILMAIFTICTIFYLSIICKLQSTQIFEKTNSSSNYVKTCYRAIAIYGQCYNVFLVFTIVELLFHSYFFSINHIENSLNYARVVFSVLALIFVLLFNFAKLFLIEENITLVFKGFKKLNNSYIDFLFFLVKFI